MLPLSNNPIKDVTAGAVGLSISRMFLNSNGAVLVLNASYEPLHVVSTRRAVILLLKEKAEVVEASEQLLRSERLGLKKPLVIRLIQYVKVPRQMALPLTRRLVLARDAYTCQYCGIQPSKAALTIDHVLPRSQGGEKSWVNVVAACRPCNQRKGNRTPLEANMPLARKPFRPRYVALAIVNNVQHPDVWRKYMG